MWRLVLIKNRHIPLRSCTVCGLKVPKGQLVRIAKTDQKSIAVDITGKEPGRGAYICHVSDCWDQVLEKGALERSFKQSLSAKDLQSVRTYYQENVAPRDTYPKL